MDTNETTAPKCSALETAQTAYAWASLVVGAASAVYVGSLIVAGAVEVAKEKRQERRALKAAIGTLQDED